jgi:hypothetical protein
LPKLIEQPGVLDGDDCLGGEVLQEGDLLVGEGKHFLSVNGEHADGLVLLQQWDTEVRPYTPEFDGFHDARITLFSVGSLFCSIQKVHYRLVCHRAP